MEIASQKWGKKPIAFQRGTGKHFDINPHSVWKKQLRQNPKGDSDYTQLDLWRAFQSQVVLRDQKFGDSALEVLAGIHLFAVAYYKLGVKNEGLNVARRGSYSCYLFQKLNPDLMDKFTYARRIPKNWNPEKMEKIPSIEEINKMTRKDISNWLEKLKKELEVELDDTIPQEGDFILWDSREAHANGDRNNSDQIRQTFYHAYLPDVSVNRESSKKIRLARETGMHPPDFPKKYADLEMPGYKKFNLSNLGKKLYGYDSWRSDETLDTKEGKKEEEEEGVIKLTSREIEFYKRYGFLVVENVIDRSITSGLRDEIDAFVKRFGLDISDISTVNPETWSKVGEKFGGMLELYWLPKMEEIRQHPNPYWVAVQLLENTWSSGTVPHFEQPFGKFDPRHLLLYVDRTNLRFPNKLVDNQEALKRFIEQKKAKNSKVKRKRYNK